MSCPGGWGVGGGGGRGEEGRECVREGEKGRECVCNPMTIFLSLCP